MASRINSNTLLKNIKNLVKLFMFLFGFLFVVVVIINGADQDDVVYRSLFEKKKQYVEIVTPPEVIPSLNENGTTNGINLLLISKLSGGFIKEYLTLAKENQEGKLNDYPTHIPIEGVIGLAMAEEGGYAQCPTIPNTCLPWDNSTMSPKWEEGSPWTLAKADMSILSSNHNSQAWYVGSYASPYQQTPSYFTNGMYKPSNLLGVGMSSGRTTGDWSYFPDQLAGLDHEYNNIFGLDATKLSAEAKLMNASFNHNVGASWRSQFLSTYKGGDYTEGLNDLAGTFQAGFDKYQGKFDNILDEIDAQGLKFVAAFILMEDGWNLTQRSADSSGGNTSYYSLSVANKGVGFKAFTLLGLGTTQTEYQSYLINHLKEPSDFGNCGRAATQGTMWKDYKGEGNMYMLVETSGHALASAFIGPVFYARLLKTAGLDSVDPTDPSTYMNEIKNNTPGTWVPDGTEDWMTKSGVDVSKLNANRAKLLQEGHKVLGVNYVWGGATWPTQNTDGTYNLTTGALDCSGYTSNLYMRVMGVWIGRTTYDQIASPLLEKIEPTDAKPGDLIFNDSIGHVLVYLSGDLSDGPICMHAPQTGEVIKINKYHKVSLVYRLKGIDD